MDYFEIVPERLYILKVEGKKVVGRAVALSELFDGWYVYLVVRQCTVVVATSDFIEPY